MYVLNILYLCIVYIKIDIGAAARAGNTGGNDHEFQDGLRRIVPRPRR
jgi:hypothetical protein